MSTTPEIKPWEVSSEFKEADYDKVANEFGARLIDDPMLNRIQGIAGDLHPFLQQKIFYAHRDLDVILDGHSKGEKFYLYTGRGPSGSMHLGHILPFLFTRWLQERFGVDLVIQITDDEKFLFRDVSGKDLEKYTRENILDILSVGFDPEKTHVLVDTKNSGLLYNSAIKVARHINASSVKAVFGFTDSDNIGKYFFTSMQSVPAFLLSELAGRNIRCLIPYAIDQDPHFKLSRDVLPKLGFFKPSSIISKFIPSLKGSGKMSSSDQTTGIYLDDPPKVVRKKLMKYAFSGGRDTAEEQRKYGANPDVDFAFNVYRMLEADQGETAKVYEEYRSGRMLSGEMKSLAADRINEFLEKLQSQREVAAHDYDSYFFDPDEFRE